MHLFTKQSILDKQIDVFLYWCISQGIMEGTYNYWLREFSKNFKGTAYDIEDGDKIEFLTKVSVLYNGQHSLDQANRAINGLQIYYMARGKNLGKRLIKGLKSTNPLTV